MKFYHRIILLFLISTSVCLNLREIKWGIPSKERTELVFPEQLRNESFYRLMKQTREEIYKFSDGSPVGYIRDLSSSLTPVLKSIGVQENENVHFNGEEKILANFIRPYLLRSNHTDEQMTIASLAGMHPKSFDFNPRIFHYGGVYIYGLGAWLGLSHILGLIKISPDLSFYLQHPDEMGKIFTAGRVINIIFSVFTMIILFTISKKIYSVRTAILSIIFFTVCPAMVFQAHIMKPYIIATFFAMLCIYYSLEIVTNPSTKNYVFCGIALGLTVGTMYVYGIVTLAFMVAHFIVSAFQKRQRLTAEARNSGNAESKIFSVFPSFRVSVVYLAVIKTLNKKFFCFCFAFVIIFILTNPYYLIKFKDAHWELSLGMGAYTARNLSGIVNCFVHKLLLGFPSLLSLICICGLVLAIFQRRTLDIVLISVSVIPLLVFGVLLGDQESSMHNTRLLLPWIAVLLILGARFIDIFLNKKYINSFIILLVVFATIQSSLNCLVFAKNFAMDSSVASTRFEAGRWIQDNIPARSTIGIANLPEPAHVPPFDFTKYKIIYIRKLSDKKMPDYFIVINKIPDHYIQNGFGNYYASIKSFEPIDKILGIKFNIGYNHINSLVTIYKRNI